MSNETAQSENRAVGKPRSRKTAQSENRAVGKPRSRKTAQFRLHVRKKRITFNRFRPGDVVRYCSKIRPDLLPSSCDKHGIVISAGIWGVFVAFNDFPHEPFYVGAKELKYATGVIAGQTHSERQRAKSKRAAAINTKWD